MTNGGPLVLALPEVRESKLRVFGGERKNPSTLSSNQRLRLSLVSSVNVKSRFYETSD